MIEHEQAEEEHEDEGSEEAEGEATPAPAQRPRDVADGEVESIQEIIEKKESAGDEEEDTVLSMTREERLEPLAVKVVPKQSSEFVCKNCYLVKHRSQLKDEKRMLCRDCA